jgi:uncharacterized Zn finger protein
MIQAVVDNSAFHIGNQYVSENRVRIVQADDQQITSAVIGKSGLYEQTIRLKDGHLVSKCSCALPEEPICRHCVAVLLEYHRWSQPREAQRSREPKEEKSRNRAGESANGKAASEQPATGDVKLSEVMQFIEWLQPAMKAIQRGQTLPTPPSLGAGEIAQWIQSIRELDDSRRTAEDGQERLQADIRDREAYVGRLTQQLQASIAEAKAAQAATQDLRSNVDTYKGLLDKVAELSSEVARCDGQVKAMAGEIISKGAQLEKLAGSFKEVAETLKSIAKQVPPR